MKFVSLHIVDIYIKYCEAGMKINPKKFKPQLEMLYQIKRGIILDFDKLKSKNDIQ